MSNGFPPPSLKALSTLNRSEDWARVAWRSLSEAARDGAVLSPRAGAYASEIGLSRESADTPNGNLVDVLERGPTSAAERTLARAIAASAFRHALSTNALPPKDIVGLALWLATSSSFDASSQLASTTGAPLAGITEALAETIRGVDNPASRTQALLAAAVLGAMPKSEASARVSAEVRDPIVERLLAGASTPTGGGIARLEGNVESGPRAPWLTTLMAISGVLFAVHAARLVGRFVLRYRRSGEISLDGGQLRLHTKTEVLGRTLTVSDATLPATGLKRLARETTYPRAAFYGGLVSLLTGTAIGVWFIADGVRAASPTLLGWGLLAIVLGAAVDFWASSIRPQAVGEARLVVEPLRGQSFAFVGADAARIDDFLRRVQ